MALRQCEFWVSIDQQPSLSLALSYYMQKPGGLIWLSNASNSVRVIQFRKQKFNDKTMWFY